VSLPRPLLIVLVLLIVLGVASCGASIALSRGDGVLSDAGKDTELRQGSLADQFSRFAPQSEPVVLEPGNAPCLEPNGRLEFDAGCTFSIPRTNDLRRRLELEVAPGVIVRMQVFVTSGGQTRPSDPALVPSETEDASVVVARDDSAVVVLTCQALTTCVVLVNP